MKKNKGFTLIELMIVIVILLIIGAVLIPTIVGVTMDINSKTEQVEIITQEEEMSLESNTAPEQKEVEVIKQEGESNRL